MTSGWKQVAVLNRWTGIGLAEKLRFEESFENKSSKYWERNILNGGISQCKDLRVLSRNK